MIRDENITLNVNNSNKKYYLDKGYEIINNTFYIKTIDLSPYSKLKIYCLCDIEDCNNETHISFSNYRKITNNLTEKYYCKLCKYKKVAITNSLKSEEEKQIKIEKIKLTNLEKYGHVCILQSDSILKKIKLKNIELYGFENVSKSEIIKRRKEETCEKNNGVKFALLLENNKDKRANGYNKYLENQRNEIVEKYSKLISDNFKILNYNNSIFEILDMRDNTIFNIHNIRLKDRLKWSNTEISTIKNPLGSKCISGLEIQLRDFISSLNVDIIENSKKIINPKELDIYIPTHNLAIEFNGLYWHNEEHYDKTYHLNKSIRCNENGIDLIHIFEDDWMYKQEIVKSIISNRLGKIENKIFARKCVIKEVSDSKLVRRFLDDNHIQGYSQSSIKLGLFHNNELVSLMTFGYRHTNKKKEFELIRFCNKINTNVIGASSKLFNFLLNNFDYDFILSYSDYSMFNGKMYETLGFEKIHLSEPNYFWIVDDVRYHRFNYNKQKLIKDGYDPNKTEIEIMHERGYKRIWGCGQVRWEYKKEIKY